MLAVAKRLGLYNRELNEAADREFMFLWAAFNPTQIEGGRSVRRQVTAPTSAGKAAGRICSSSGSGLCLNSLGEGTAAVGSLDKLAS